MEWWEYLFGPINDPKTFSTKNNVSIVYTYDLNLPYNFEKENIDRIFWVVDSPSLPQQGKLIFPTKDDRSLFLEFLEEDVLLWETLYYCLKHEVIKILLNGGKGD